MKAKPPSEFEAPTVTSDGLDEHLLLEISNRLAKELSLEALDVRRVIEGHLSKFKQTDNRDEALRAFYALLWNESELN